MKQWADMWRSCSSHESRIGLMRISASSFPVLPSPFNENNESRLSLLCHGFIRAWNTSTFIWVRIRELLFWNDLPLTSLTDYSVTDRFKKDGVSQGDSMASSRKDSAPKGVLTLSYPLRIFSGRLAEGLRKSSCTLKIVRRMKTSDMVSLSAAGPLERKCRLSDLAKVILVQVGFKWLTLFVIFILRIFKDLDIDFPPTVGQVNVVLHIIPEENTLYVYALHLRLNVGN